ncbi:hypothetical protein C8R43DRAFT_542897 [Mycena crocata]|nr:hypothetical protein C8R43DRAFT_542897 [Mycena crocata]
MAQLENGRVKIEAGDEKPSEVGLLTARVQRLEEEVAELRRRDSERQDNAGSGENEVKVKVEQDNAGSGENDPVNVKIEQENCSALQVKCGSIMQVNTARFKQAEGGNPASNIPSSTPTVGIGGPIQRAGDVQKKTTTLVTSTLTAPLDLRVNTRNARNVTQEPIRKSQIASQTAPSNGHEPSAPKKVDNAKFLPIKAWYLGLKHFEEAYHLVWTNNGKVIIRSGKAPGPPARHTEEVDIDMAVERAWFCDPHDSYPDKFIVIETYGKFKNTANHQPIGAQYPDFFKQGETHGRGEIHIKFDLSSEAWADTVYKTFVDWFKPRVDNREILRGQAGAKKWDVANRMSLLAQTRASRESGSDSLSKPLPTKTPAVPGLPPLDIWSTPPPPPFRSMIANTAKAPVARRRSEFPKLPPLASESPSAQINAGPCIPQRRESTIVDPSRPACRGKRQIDQNTETSAAKKRKTELNQSVRNASE